MLLPLQPRASSALQRRVIELEQLNASIGTLAQASATANHAQAG
jgi:hypothetical protein